MVIAQGRDRRLNTTSDLAIEMNNAKHAPRNMKKLLTPIMGFLGPRFSDQALEGLKMVCIV